MTALFAFSVFIFVIAVCGAVYTQLPKYIPNLSFLYFFLSLTAQLLAMPLLLVAAALCVLSLTRWAPAPEMAALNGLSVLLLALNIWRAVRGGKILDNILPEEKSAPAAGFFMGGLLPFKIKHKNVTRSADIAYGDAGVRNLLDMYHLRDKPTAPMPVLIHIHGGAWVVGQKKQQAQPLIHHMASQGWLVLDINYRMGPVHSMTEVFSDVLRAIAWTKTRIAEYGGDPGFVALTGGSAGGHLTALAALRPNDPGFKDGFADVDCRVDAAVPVYGVYDFLNRTGDMKLGQKELEAFLTKRVMPGSPETHREFWDMVSPMGNIHEDAPPMFVNHGRHDALAAFKGAEIFVNALRQTSKNEVLFAALPGGQHAYDSSNGAPTPSHVQAVERFLNKIRAEKSA